ncbi:hypothetical protein [Marinobacter zhanjiangensis]|uniref:hypothetical protein n=1 Tax=Marinobacter zhanjiangensis TaxID=578215 RepID=UPI0016788AEF|nr:hypothetical protein [Marinobacter zhanjiangensis]
MLADSHRRFRWLVALTVLAFAVWFLLDALEDTVERAEQQSVKLMLNQVRSALVVRGAEAMLARDETLESLQGLNPLPLLRWEGEQPLTEENCTTLAPDERGWCFDSERHWLVYQPGQPLDMEGRQREAGEPFAWQVRVSYAGTVKQGKNNGKRATGLKLVEVDRHQISENE